jgi:hypothetical protein
MRYQFVVQLSLACAWLAQSPSVHAGAIEGAVAFPSRLVPSLTVYAWNLDTLRIHSVQLERGRASFSIDVPAGRYWVFLAPNEPGAPNIYGAYTQYSLCAAHDVQGKCDDHALIPVSVSDAAARAAVTIDDWYLTDDVAAQIDRIRGIAAGDTARFSPEPLSAPRFSEYPSDAFDAGSPPQADFSGSELAAEDRETVHRALAGGPNFAGHLTAALTRCGPTCGRLVLVDWHDGRVLEPAPLAAIEGPLPCRGREALMVRRDSRLMSISRTRAGAVVTQYFVWNQNNAELVQSNEYQRNSRTFCAVAAR